MDSSSPNVMRCPADAPPAAARTEIPSFALIGPQIEQVRRLIRDCLTDSAGPLDVKPLLEHITSHSGKMLRPGLLLLSGLCCGKITDTHITVAAVVEMVHNATLLHDDVVDGGQTRRGIPTVNRLWGNESAVLLGDYLLSRVFKMSAELEPTIAKMIASIAVRVCQGELRQALHKDDWQLTESEYMGIITEKSAAFFSGCCRLGAVLSGASDAQVCALAEFGLNSGIAFQITDDLLDLTGNKDSTGKTTDSDVTNSRLTLPVIRLLSLAEHAIDSRIRTLLTSPAGPKGELKQMLDSSGSLQYAKCKAQEFVSMAVHCLSNLPHTPAKQALVDTAMFMANRGM